MIIQRILFVQESFIACQSSSSSSYTELLFPTSSQNMADVFRGLNLLETLKESVERNKLSEVKDAVEDLLISRINLAVVGQPGEEKAALVQSLCGLGPQDVGVASQNGVTMYSTPQHPDFHLWDMPPVPSAAPFEAESYMDRVKFHRHNVVLMASAQAPAANGVAVFLEALSLQQKTVYFVLLHAGNRAGEERPDERRRGGLEALASRGVTEPRVYVVDPSRLDRLDFPSLLQDIQRDLPEVRAHALLLALPAFSSAVVAQKKEAFQALVWAAASLSGGLSAVPVPFVASLADSEIAVRILSRAQASLCVDDASVERLARRQGAEPAKITGLRTCSLSAEVTKAEVKRRLAAAQSDSSISSRLVGMALPRHARSAGRSFTAMLNALNAAIEEMAADADRIVTAVLAFQK